MTKLIRPRHHTFELFVFSQGHVQEARDFLATATNSVGTVISKGGIKGRTYYKEGQREFDLRSGDGFVRSSSGVIKFITKNDLHDYYQEVPNDTLEVWLDHKVVGSIKFKDGDLDFLFETGTFVASAEGAIDGNSLLGALTAARPAKSDETRDEKADRLAAQIGDLVRELRALNGAA